MAGVSDEDHHCWFEMVQVGMACACGEKITARRGTDWRRLEEVLAAMLAEGVVVPVAERVINRLAFGKPPGAVGLMQAQREKGGTARVTVHMNAPLSWPNILAGAVREYSEQMR